MPRNPGTGIYTKPYPDVISDTTIESTVHNGEIADIETDLNTPRPIVAGGTGANNAPQARANLGAEVGSLSQVVTNYDTQVWASGSFSSFPGATSAPMPTENFVGTAVLLTPDQQYIILNATSVDTGLAYFRRKGAGVWGGWLRSDIAMDNAKVNRSGDTMTGDLTINKASAQLILNKAGAAGAVNVLMGKRADTNRWAVLLGDGNVNDTGGNVGSDFSIYRYDDAGAYLGQPINVSRGTGLLTVTGQTNIVGNTGITGTFGASGAVSFASNLTVTGDTALNGTNFTVAQGVQARGYRAKPGMDGAVRANHFNIDVTSGTQMWIDTTNLGTITVTSDYRIKKDVTDLASTWDTVKALRPIKYTQAQFSPPSHVEYVTSLMTKEGSVAPGDLYEADDIERWGFIAHELQETLVPSAATGVKDSPDTVQSPNPFTLIAALTKALQEAMARIEALEAAQATP